MTTALLRRGARGVAIVATVAGVSVVPTLTAGPATATAPATTTLSIRTVHSAVAPGGSTNITGVLLEHGTGGTPGRTVTLEAKPEGTVDFVPVAEAITREHGGVRVSVTPATTTRYRWHYAGDTDTRPSVSGVARIRVRTPDGDPATRLNTTLAIRVQHRVVDPGGQNVIRGRLASHRIPVRNRWVVLVSRTPGSSGWAFGTVQQTGADGRVSFAVQPDQRISYRLAFLGTPLLQPVRSAIVHVGVRPTVSATATPDALNPGETTTISGLVVTGDVPVAGAPVELLARAVGATGPLEVVGTGTTAADGTVAIAATPASSTFYRLRVLRTEGIPRALSPRVRVVVRSTTSLSIRGRSTTTAYVVTGVLHGRGQMLVHRPVTLMAQAPGTPEWVAVDSALTAERGKVRFDQPLAPGTGYLLAYAGGPRLAPSSSGTVVQ
jgi:hypothetical protein